MSKMFANRFRHFNAMGVIAAGFAAIILAGSLLLSAPVSSANGRGVPWFDALFTSTSAVCVTGLVTVDTGTTFSRFGHWVLPYIYFFICCSAAFSSRETCAWEMPISSATSIWVFP